MQHRDQEAEMLEANQGLVISIAKKYFSCHLSFEDKLQEGNIGLLKAIRKFDPAIGCKFSTYAVLWVKAMILRAIKEKEHTVKVPVYLQDNIHRCEKKKNAAFVEEGVWLDFDETLEEWQNPELFIRAKKYLSQYHDSSEDLYGLENSPGPDDTFAVVSQRLIRDILKDAIDVLPFREKEVLRNRFPLGENRRRKFKELEKDLGITAQRVQQIEEEALRKLKVIFNKKEARKSIGNKYKSLTL